MTDELLSLGRVNGYINKLLSQISLTDDKFEKKDLVSKINNLINNERYSTRITPTTYLNIKRGVESFVDSKNWNDFEDRYEPQNPTIGKTFILLVKYDDSNEGACHFIKIAKKDTAITTENQLLEHYNKVLDCVGDALIKYKVKNELLVHNKLNEYAPFIVNFAGEPISQNVSGASLQLPLAIAVFSFFSGFKIPSDIAMSGALNDDGITWVSGINTKISALLEEYDEITRVLLPKSTRGNVAETTKELDIFEVENFDQALRIVFPDLVENKKIKLKESLKFKVFRTLVPSKPNSNLILLECIKTLDDKSVIITPKILKQVDEYLAHLKQFLESYSKINKTKISGIIVSDDLTKWFTSRIVIHFKNKFDVIIINVPNSDSVVVEVRNHNSFYIGEGIKFATFEEIELNNNS